MSIITWKMLFLNLIKGEKTHDPGFWYLYWSVYYLVYQDTTGTFHIDQTLIYFALFLQSPILMMTEEG